MRDYEIGYKKPPAHTRFKKGVCANPKGRGASIKLRAGKIFESVLEKPMQITDHGKSRRVKLPELMFRGWVRMALEGNVKAAELVLDEHAYSKVHGDYRHIPKPAPKWGVNSRAKITLNMTSKEASEAYTALLKQQDEEWGKDR